MTIIVFDGKCLVADGRAVLKNNKFPEYLSTEDVTKIVVLPNPWVYLNNTVLMAIAGTGVESDIEMVKTEIFRALHQGELGNDFTNRFEFCFKEKFNCNIVGIGIATKPNGEKIPVPIRVYSGNKQNKIFHTHIWSNSSTDKFSVAGSIKTLPSDLNMSDIFNNGVELASWVSSTNPRMVGGLLTRYNPITGKLDHPNHTQGEKLISINKKILKLESKRVLEKYSYYENMINKTV